jgi:hypothetical protein
MNLSIRISMYNQDDPIMVATGIETTKEAGEMADHFLHEGFSLIGIEPEDIMSISIVKEVEFLQERNGLELRYVNAEVGYVDEFKPSSGLSDEE